jgi:chorismate mutase
MTLLETTTNAISIDVELELLDRELLRLVMRRQELTRQAALRRGEAGLPRFHHGGEFAVIERYRVLGRSGLELASILLRMSRS